MKTKVIAVALQKGGVGKTTTSASLGIGLAKEGKKVLLIDSDPQGSLTISLGIKEPDELDITLSTIMDKIINDKPIGEREGLIHHDEGVDLLPANIELSGTEVSLINAMSRETVLKEYISSLGGQYDYIVIDTPPSLSMLTINALGCADSIIIPVQAQYLSAKGLEQLLQTINKMKRQINPNLKIEGILVTMVDIRTNLSKDISNIIKETYANKIPIFKTDIPHSIKMAETTLVGESIYQYEPKSKVAEAYRDLTKEVLRNEKVRTKSKSKECR